MLTVNVYKFNSKLGETVGIASGNLVKLTRKSFHNQIITIQLTKNGVDTEQSFNSAEGLFFVILSKEHGVVYHSKEGIIKSPELNKFLAS